MVIFEDICSDCQSQGLGINALECIGPRLQNFE